MQIARHDFVLKRGDTFIQDLVFKYQADQSIVNLSTVTARCQVRPSMDSAILTQEMTVLVVPAEGRIQLLIPSNESALIKSGFYVYDLKLTDSTSATVSYDIEGKFIVTGSATE